MKPSSLFQSLVLLLMLSGCNSSEVARDSANCHKVEKGMSPMEVIAITGEPKSRFVSESTPGYMSFSYSYPFMASGEIMIAFKDRGSGYEVQYAFCDGQP